jgi:carboxylate-amine ligase
MFSSAPAFGIEEEFFLCERASRAIVRSPPPGFVVDCRKALGPLVSSELLQSQVEVKTPRLTDLAAARAALLEGRAALAEVAARHGMRIMAAGTHPLAEWREQFATASERYEELFDDFQIVAQRNLLCGLHVHAEVPPGLDRIRLMNDVLRWLPLLLALSASSPFWSRRPTGLKSYRQAAYDEWPRTGIPRLFADEAEYEGYLEVLIRTGAIRDASYIWWAVRPSARFPTLELRITDSCPRVDDVLCIADLFRLVVRQAVLDARSDAPALRQGIERLLIEENRWRAKRFGCAATFVDATVQHAVSASDTLDALVHACRRARADVDADRSIAHARQLLATGGSADRQLDVFHRALAAGAAPRRALQRVVDQLIAETHGDAGAG